MKKYMITLAAVLVAPLLVFGVASAVEEPTHTDGNASNQGQTTETKRKTGTEGMTLEQRLEKYKAEAKTRLNAAQKVRIQARCKASQTVVGNVKTRVGQIDNRRDTAYKAMMTHLNNLTPKLKSKGLDTTTYEAQLVELQTKIDTFQTDLAKYKEAVDDLAAMDCAADPDAFKASLEAARTLRAQVVKDGQAVHDFLKNTVKPTLQSMRTQIGSSMQEQQ